MSFNPRRGPCYVFYGDPTTAAGADMKYLGFTRGDVVVNPNLNISTGYADQTGLTPRADSVYDSGATPMVQVPFIDEETAKMAAYILGSTTVINGGKNALGFSAGPAVIPVAKIGTLALIPMNEITSGANGIDAPNGIWLPRAIPTAIGEFTFKLEDGDDNFSPHTVEFAGAYYEKDQDDKVIDKNIRRGFIGAPGADSGLNWFLPVIV